MVTSLYPRFMEPVIRHALTYKRVVTVVGPRQSGKSTLVVKIAEDLGMHYLSLDDPDILEQAEKDPKSLIVPGERYVFDEVQRAPKLIYVIKMAVDRDQTPGCFLITGSVHPYRSGLAPDSLAGRTENLELLPLSQGEIHRIKDPLAFMDQAFTNEFSQPLYKAKSELEIYEQILNGGYSMALGRSTKLRGIDLRNYASSLLEQEFLKIHATEDQSVGKLPKLLKLASELQSQLISTQDLSNKLQTNPKNTEIWLHLFQLMYLLHLVMPWHSKQSKRITKEHKLYFIDSGLISALRKETLESLTQDGKTMGALMEGFVFSELAKMCSLTQGDIEIYHYRTPDQLEVDLVLEKQRKVVGIEVKAAKKVHSDDFKGLRRLKEEAGMQFSCGVILYQGEEKFSPEPDLHALPYHSLWSLGGEYYDTQS